MTEKPNVTFGAWISIGDIDAVVAQVREPPSDHFGDMTVVYWHGGRRRTQVVDHDVRWNSESGTWEFIGEPEARLADKGRRCDAILLGGRTW